ncbi:hypothetical protein M569_14548, partial [Genlisea aurea]
SPETPWMRSPARASPSRAFMYHCLVSLHRSDGNILSLAVTKDFIFAGSSSCRVHVFKQPDCVETGCIKTASGHVRACLSIGKMLVTAHGDCRVRLWDVSAADRTKIKPSKMMTLPKRNAFLPYGKKTNQHRDCISCLAFNGAEKLLYTGSWDRTVRVWRLTEKKCVDCFVAHDGNVNAIVVNQQDGCVFTCSSDGTVKIWRRVVQDSPHFLTMTLKFQPSPVNSLALSKSPVGCCYLYSGSSDGLINFWEKEKISGRYNHAGFLQGHHFAVLCMVTIEDLLLSGSEDATIRIWKRDDNGSSSNGFHACLAVIDGHHGPVKCLAVAVETAEMVRGLLVYSASLDQTLKLWRVKVYPGENAEKKEDHNGDCFFAMEAAKMSPVLSPSWVERKIQGSDY